MPVSIHMVRRVIILGAPGSGKGTQASRLGKEFGWAHVSTGDMLRAAVQRGTALGLEANEYMIKGELVPDDLMIGLVMDRLNQNDCRNGFILDGFPRTVTQAEKLDSMLSRSRMLLDGVINIDVTAEEVVMRLSQRLVCADCGTIVTTDKNVNAGNSCIHCGGRLVRRKDDEPETIRHRLEVYKRETLSLIQYYDEKQVLKTVDGHGSMDDVYKRVISVLEISTVNA